MNIPRFKTELARRLALGLTLFAPVSLMAQEAALPAVHLLQTQSVDCQVRVSVNGFPLTTLPGDGNTGDSNGVLSAFLRKGRNTIAYDFEPLAVAGGEAKTSWLLAGRLVRLADVNAAVQTPVIEFERTEDGAANEPNCTTSVLTAGAETHRLAIVGGGRATEVVIDATSGQVRGGARPGAADLVTLELDIPDCGLDTLPWLEGLPAVPPTPEEIAAMKLLVIAAHEAVVAKDFSELATVLDAKYARRAAALGQVKAEIVAEDVTTLAALLGGAGFQMTPLDPAAIQFEMVGTLNLAKAVVNGQSPLRGSDGEIDFSLDLYFSKSGGQWIVVE